MTTTAEERSRAILKAHADTMAALRDAPRDELRLEGTKAMFALEEAITQAIAQAQNDKLEEAARLMERVMADSKAALIRTLKSKD